MKSLFRKLFIVVFMCTMSFIELRPAFAQDPISAAIVAAAAGLGKELAPKLIEWAGESGKWLFGRSVTIMFENYTDLVLEKGGDGHFDGAFGKMLPYPRLSPNGYTVFGSRGTGLWPSTTGWVEYWTPGQTLAVCRREFILSLNWPKSVSSELRKIA